jgi:hypothetical protein
MFDLQPGWGWQERFFHAHVGELNACDNDQSMLDERESEVLEEDAGGKAHIGPQSGQPQLARASQNRPHKKSSNPPPGVASGHIEVIDEPIGLKVCIADQVAGIVGDEGLQAAHFMRPTLHVGMIWSPGFELLGQVVLRGQTMNGRMEDPVELNLVSQAKATNQHT